MGQRRWIKRSVRLVDSPMLTIGTPVGFAMAIAGGARPLADRRSRHGVGDYSDVAALGGWIL